MIRQIEVCVVLFVLFFVPSLFSREKEAIELFHGDRSGHSCKVAGFAGFLVGRSSRRDSIRWLH